MIKKRTFLIIIILMLTGFGIGVYLQDLKHQESTKTYWIANRHNMQRLTNIQKITARTNVRNWQSMRDSIYQQLDTLIILRFRKEMDSLDVSRATSKK